MVIRMKKMMKLGEAKSFCVGRVRVGSPSDAYDRTRMRGSWYVQLVFKISVRLSLQNGTGY